MNIIERLNSKGDKINFYYDYGRKKGQRPSTRIFIYTKPKDQVQRNHNKQSLALLEVKKSQLTIEQQAIGSAFILRYYLYASSDGVIAKNQRMKRNRLITFDQSIPSEFT